MPRTVPPCLWKRQPALAESILLTLGAGRNPAVLLSTDLHTDFRQGQRRLSQKLMLSQHLLQTALASRPHIENRSLSDTLNSLKSFSKRWGWQFWETIPGTLSIPASRWQKLENRLTGLSRKTLADTLSAGAAALCSALEPPPALPLHTQTTAQNLLPRLRAALQGGTTAHLFLSL